MKNTKKHGLKILAIILSSILTTGTLPGPIFGAQASEDVKLSVVAESAEEDGNSEETNISETAEEENTDIEKIEETVDDNDGYDEDGDFVSEEPLFTEDTESAETGNTDASSESSSYAEPEEFDSRDSSQASDDNSVEKVEKSSDQDGTGEDASTSSSAQYDDFDSTNESSEEKRNTTSSEESAPQQGTEEVIEAAPAEQNIVTTKAQTRDLSFSDYKEIEYGGHIYQYHDEMPFSEAKSYCESFGGHLLTISEWEEDAAMVNYLWSINKTTSLLGLADKAGNGSWDSWITGETMTEMFWGRSNPNVRQIVPVLDSSTVAAYGYGWSAGQWHLVPDNSGFICEWDSNGFTAEIHYELANEDKNFIYTGSKIAPTVDVFFYGELLQKEVDYSIEYQNNTDVGKASILITGKGKYLGNDVTKSFNIIPPVPVNISLNNIEHEAPRSMNVKWECLGNDRFQYQFQIDLYESESGQLFETQYEFGVQEHVFKELKKDTEYYVEIHAELLKEGELFLGEVSSPQKCTSENKLVPSDFWGVENRQENIDSSFFERFFSATRADTFGEKDYSLCNAMSIAALASLSYSNLTNQIPSVESFGVEKLGDIEDWNIRNSENDMSLLEYIKYAKAYTRTHSSTERQWIANKGNLSGLKDEMVLAEKSGRGVVISIDGNILWTKIGKGHSIVGLEIVEDNSFSTTIRVYDPNYPNDNNRFLYLYKSNNTYSSFHYESDGCFYDGLSGASGSDNIFIDDILTWRTINAEDFATKMAVLNGNNFDDWYLVNVEPIINQWNWPEAWKNLWTEYVQEELDFTQVYEMDFLQVNNCFVEIISEYLEIDFSNGNEGNNVENIQFYGKLKDGILKSVPGNVALSFIGNENVYTITTSNESDIQLKTNSNDISYFAINSESPNTIIVDIKNYSKSSTPRKTIICTSEKNIETRIEINEKNILNISGANTLSSIIDNDLTRVTEILSVSRDSIYSIDYTTEIPKLFEKAPDSSVFEEITWEEYDEYKDLAVIDSGNCGTNVTWKLYEDGKLVIRGNGKMAYQETICPDSLRQSVLSLEIKPGVTYISQIAFENFINLRTVEIPDTVSSIGDWAFKGCSSLTSVTIPNGVADIGKFAFQDCSKLRTIILPTTLKTIGYLAFGNCKSLCEIKIPQGVTSIGSAAFSGCDSLSSVSIPNSITEIADNVFAGCHNLKSVNIPDGATKIGGAAFYDCSSLEEIIIPDSVTEVDGHAFNKCIALKHIILSNNLKVLRTEVFSYCKSLSDISLPDSVTTIEHRAFGDCTNLGYIIVPNSVNEISNSSFSLCDLSKLVICGVKDSYPEKYANEKGIKFIDRTKIEYCTITGLAHKTYTGKAITQALTVKIGPQTLTPNSDYTVSYSNNTNAGTATVTITGIGNYTGTKTTTFKINKASQSITVKSTASSIAVGKTATVSISGAKGTKSYKSSDTSVATVNASTGVVTGKKAGTVTITATAAATANYNAASKTVKITVTAQKTLKKPGNCHFVKWNNSKYSSCRIGWNKVDGADGYQTLLSWTDGSHASTTYVKSNVLYRDCSVAVNHVSQMKARAFYASGGKKVFGPWSNVEYITPSPTTLTKKNVSPSGSDLRMQIGWNIIYGCNGYNVFLTTNPNGTWYWNQSTSELATSTKATVVKYRGSKLKKNQNYYVRIVTRRKRNGVFCTVPMPANNTNIGSFVIK